MTNGTMQVVCRSSNGDEFKGNRRRYRRRVGQHFKFSLMFTRQQSEEVSED